MTLQIDSSDVPPVSVSELYAPMRRLIANGRGLALLNGMTEAEIRDVESAIWSDFADQPHLRIAIALRFRALLDVFARRRLKQAFLEQGFKSIARAVAEASSQRLNVRYGFCAQKFVGVLSDPYRRAAPTIASEAVYAAAA
jgi:hypothetical protein